MPRRGQGTDEPPPCGPAGRVRARGAAASRLVGATPGWERLLVMPQPSAWLRRSSSRREEPGSDLRLAVGAIRRRRSAPSCRSSQLMRPLRAATLSWEVTRARPARSRGSRCATRATWPRWLVPNCSSNPSAVVCRSGGVMTPALLIRMWIGRPSSRRVAPSAAVEAREDRSSSRSDTAAAGVCSRIAAIAAWPLRGLRTGRTTSAPAAASLRAIPSPMPSLAPVTTARLPVRSGT